MRDVLKLAENFEIEGYRFYHQKMKEVKSKRVAEVFEYLAEMEKEHTEFIRRLINDIEGGREISFQISEKPEIFTKRYQTQALESTPVEDDLQDLAVLRMAYLIEKDFMEFYTRSAERVEDNDLKKILLLLRDWEAGHKEIIEREIKTILERNNLDLGFYPF